MNDIRHILVLVNDSPRSDRVLALATRLATRHRATLEAVHAIERMRSGAFISAEAASVAASWVLETESRRHNEAAARVDAAAAASGLAIPLAPLHGDAVAETLRHAATADLVVLSQHVSEVDDGSPRHFIDRLLVASGTPLLFVPHADTLLLHDDGAPACGSRILVAWSQSRESVRAMRDALPWLAAADHVELVRYLPSGDEGGGHLDEAVAYLARHGVAATAQVLHAPSPSLGERLLSTWTVDASIGQALLSHAADAAADLLVMGGYGHPRAWELTMGGVTRTVLQSMTLPVLMSH